MARSALVPAAPYPRFSQSALIADHTTLLASATEMATEVISGVEALKVNDGISAALSDAFKKLKISEIKSTDGNSKEPLILDETAQPVEAFKSLASKKYRACPVKAGGGEIIGTIDIRDTVKLFVEVMRGRKKVPDGTGDDMFNPDIALESWDIAILQHPDLLKGGSNATSYLAKMRPFPTFSPDTDAREVARALSSGKHIVGIEGDGPGGVGKIVTQKMLLHSLSGVLGNVTEKIKSVMKSPVISISCTAPAFEAFELMTQKDVSGLAVVDEEGKIIHNVSSADMSLWVNFAFGSASEPINLHKISVEDLLVKIRSSGSAVKTKAPVCVCQETDTVGHVVNMLVSTGYHHMWVVDSSKKPVGVVSLTDLFKV